MSFDDVCASAPPSVQPATFARPPGYHWTTSEEAVLREHYSSRGSEHCAALLPHRGLQAIYAKARALGLRAPNIGPTTGLRFARKHKISEEIDHIITAGYRTASKRGDVKVIALQAGRPRWWVSKRAVELGLTVARIKALPWSRPEMAILQEFGACDLKTIASKLREAGFKRSPTGIEVQRKRARIDTTDPDSWTARDLASLLGVDGATVADWVARRGLKAARRPWGPNGRFRITRRALLRWLQDNHGFVNLHKVDQPWFWGLVLGDKNDDGPQP
jgi:hypothetical protein